jgi:alpha-1,2-mannosyltransferase
MRSETFPRLTLLFQSLGSLAVGIEAIIRHRPQVLIDTIGCAFSYPAFYFSGCQLMAYVHYPFISSDMLKRVKTGTLSYNNSAIISESPLLSEVKLAYYQFIFMAYKTCGKFIDCVMVNSSWTKAHIEDAWSDAKVKLLYPPCDIEKFKSSRGVERTQNIVSLAQFRPEKNHELQIRAFARLLKDYPTLKSTKLILTGGARDKNDRQRVDELKSLASDLSISDRVHYEVDIGFERIQQLLCESRIGLHTMVDEHFGISVVEFMAAGLITVANNSGGPKTDIIDQGVNGFRASTEEEYATTLWEAFCMTDEDMEKMRAKSWDKVLKFSNERFNQAFVSEISTVFTS